MGDLFNWGSGSQAERDLRYKMETEALFEQAARMRASQQAQGQGGVGGGSKQGAFLVTVNTSNDSGFRIRFVTSGETSYTFVAGNGDTITGTFDFGTNIFDYEYNVSNEEFQAQFILGDPSLVTSILVDNGRISAFSNLQVFTNLSVFNADDNFLTSADFSGMTSLNQIDISDCFDPDTEDECLTTVDLTGCTSLQRLFIDDNEFSAGLPSLAGLTNLRELDVDGSQLSGTIDLSMLPNLEWCDLSSNPSITNVIISSSQPIGNDDSRLDINGASLTQESVDAILVALSENGVTDADYVNLSGGTSAAPSATGLAAIEVLEDNGWNVSVNDAPPGSISIAASSDFDIVGDFTIEMFINFSNLGGNIRPYSFGAFPNAANAISFEGGSTAYFWANAAARATGSFAPNTGQWYHFCAMRSGTDIYLFVDGVEIASPTYSDPIPSQSLPLTIGNGNESNSSLQGLISNFRWTSSAVYNVAGFSKPTTPLTDLAGTKLLIFQGTSLNAQLTDNSGNNHNGSGSGTFSYNASSPFVGVQGSLKLGVA